MVPEKGALGQIAGFPIFALSPSAIPRGTKKYIMKSKILIDIRNSGEPFLFIDYKPSEDLRDKVLGRFLLETGVADINGDGNLNNPRPLQLHALFYDQQTGRMQAMIENPQYDDIPKGPRE